MATVAEPRWLSTEEQQAWRAFLAANRLLIEALDRELVRDAGIPPTSYESLVQLSESPQRTMRMGDLAARSLSSRSRLSHAVARLEEAGWVRRETCATDKRGQLAVLTDAGFAKLEEAAKGHVGAVRCHLFDQLTPEQVAHMRDISEAIVRGLGHEGAEAAIASLGDC